MIHGNNRPFSHNVTMGKHEVHQKKIKRHGLSPGWRCITKYKQAIHYVVYRLLAIAAISFYWISMKSCPTADLSNISGRTNGPAYSTGELLNTPDADYQSERMC